MTLRYLTDKKQPNFLRLSPWASMLKGIIIVKYGDKFRSFLVFQFLIANFARRLTLLRIIY